MLWPALGACVRKLRTYFATRETMSTEIPIDTKDYERRFGKPVGRAFWSFRIV